MSDKEVSDKAKHGTTKGYELLTKKKQSQSNSVAQALLLIKCDTHFMCYVL